MDFHKTKELDEPSDQLLLPCEDHLGEAYVQIYTS